MEYTIVEGYEVEEVIAAVNERLKLGWELYGDMVISSFTDAKESSTRHLYAQAMVKKASEHWSTT
jgi:hypothetical protein